MVKAKKIVYKKAFDGMPKVDDFEIVEEDLPDIKDDEFLAKAVFLSVDPYMRAYSGMYHLGMTIVGSQVAKIIESKNIQYPVGSYVFGNFGWRSHTIYNPKEQSPLGMPPYLVSEIAGHPLSLYLGVLGMPGNTAYFGFMECCQPIPGETVVVSGAAGAVGSHVGQIAKNMGCKVIGIVGSDEKGKWLEKIGFDGYINYKTVKNLHTTLGEMTPSGIDCYFDNVGGEISSTVIQRMNMKGRVAVCGSISSYNDSATSLPKATILQPSIIMKLLTIKGLHASAYHNKWMEGIKKNREMLEEGKLNFKETVYTGFDNMPKALIGVLKGENTGKAVVKV